MSDDRSGRGDADGDVAGSEGPGVSDDKSGRGDVGGDGAGSGTAGDVPADSPETEEAPPKITLDRYLSQRRGPARSSAATLVAAVLMLIMLVVIVVYKDRCGAAVSGLMGDLEPGKGAASPGAHREQE